MAHRPPFLARVAVGAVVFALEEVRKLPQTAVGIPMNAVSQMLQTTMHAQQFVTSLAIKGDEALELLAGPAEEHPEWATFDEDEIDAEDIPVSTNGHHVAAAAFDEPEPQSRPVAAASPVAVAEIVTKLNYPALSLAQLRARLRQLSVEDLTALLAFEQAEQARAPFVTMLTNRIATTTAG
jgi:hypothetical protein